MNVVVREWENRFTMSKNVHDRTTFSNKICALYATNVILQQFKRPCGNHSKSKFYFSSKHKLYDYKNEVSVLPNGFSINCTTHTPGSVSDITILRKNLEFHRRELNKTSGEAQDHIEMGPLLGSIRSIGLWLLTKGSREPPRKFVQSPRRKYDLLVCSAWMRNGRTRKLRVIELLSKNVLGACVAFVL